MISVVNLMILDFKLENYSSVEMLKETIHDLCESVAMDVYLRFIMYLLRLSKVSKATGPDGMRF